MKTRNCSKILARLAEEKVIEVIPRRDQRGLSLPNLYRLSEGGYPVSTDIPTPVSSDSPTLSVGTDKPTYITDNRTDIEKKDPSDLVESSNSTPSLALFPESEKQTPPTPSRPGKEDLAHIVRVRLFPVFLELTDRSPKQYALTAIRLQQGIRRLAECGKKCDWDVQESIDMFVRAIEALVASEYHMQQKYNEWHNICRSAEKFDEWLGKWKPEMRAA